jgi:hypothetical protein
MAIITAGFFLVVMASRWVANTPNLDTTHSFDQPEFHGLLYSVGKAQTGDPRELSGTGMYDSHPMMAAAIKPGATEAPSTDLGWPSQGGRAGPFPCQRGCPVRRSSKATGFGRSNRKPSS